MTWSDKQGPIDMWSPIHFMGGVVLGTLEVPWYWMVGGTIIFEIAENTLAENKLVQRVVPEAGAETLINMLGDLAVNMSGWAMGRGLVSVGLMPSRKQQQQRQIRVRGRPR